MGSSRVPAQRVAATTPSLLRTLTVLVVVTLLGLAATTAPAAGRSAGRSATHSTEPVHSIPDYVSAVMAGEDPPPPVGSSRLTRTDDGLSVQLATGELRPDDVITLWWVVANAPEQCEAGIPGLSQCGPMDHLAGRGDFAVHHATGRIVEEDGTATFGAHLRVGDLSRALFDGEPGLTKPRDAEVLLVVKTHGQRIPELTAEMLRTFIGGCEIDEQVADELEKLAERGVTPRPAVFGDEGPNTDCAEIQVSVHSPGA